MTDGATNPPARERYKHGIKSWAAADPQPREALLDRVELRLRGTLVAPFEGGLARFAKRIGTGTETPLFGRVHRRGGRWQASVLSGTTISGGDLVVYQSGLDAWLDVTLVVNPTRTLAHLLDRFSFDEIEGLDETEFFARSAEPRAADRTLDGRDNMVPDFLELAGTMHSKFVQRVATYLDWFERALLWRLVHDLCPPRYGYEIGARDGVIVASDDQVQLTLDWSGLTVSQCEVCWERHDPSALERVHVLAEEVLSSARSASIATHRLGQPSVERDLGALSVKVPIVPDRIILGIYAKAIDRLRFEVRYNRSLPEEVSARLPDRPRRLTDWFDAIRDEAAERFPWANVQNLLNPPQTPSTDALADLLDAVADVTVKARPKRKSLLRQLLLHGAVTATNRDGDAPSALLERLVDRGVLEYVRLIGRDAKRGRRYRLTERYRGLVGIIEGRHT